MCMFRERVCKNPVGVILVEESDAHFLFNINTFHGLQTNTQRPIYNIHIYKHLKDIKYNDIS